MHERIRELRKKYLKLSQTEFGDKLGVSRSVIKNIELNALARPEQKLSLIKLMCKEFNVNEEWLLNGTEPMFKQNETFSLDVFVKSKGATEQEIEIVKTYFEIDPKIRRNLMEYFLTNFIPHKDTHPDTPEELESKFPPVEDNKESAG